MIKKKVNKSLPELIKCVQEESINWQRCLCISAILVAVQQESDHFLCQAKSNNLSITIHKSKSISYVKEIITLTFQESISTDMKRMFHSEACLNNKFWISWMVWEINSADLHSRPVEQEFMALLSLFKENGNQTCSTSIQLPNLRMYLKFHGQRLEQKRKLLLTSNLTKKKMLSTNH